MKIEKYSLGSDPELFLRRKDTGDYFPAIGVIKGTKARPKQMTGLPKGFTWQVDGMAAEFNTPPSSTKEEWLNNHQTALKFINQNIDEQQFEIRIDAIADFNEEYFKMPGARELGCSVDFSAYTQSTNPKPDAEVDWRSAAGHIHIGAEELKESENVERLAKVLDVFLALSSVLIDPERQRRSLYGKAGCFRFAHSFIGMEYRSLSNFWLKSDELINWVWDNTALAIQFINDGKEIDKDDEFSIQAAIDEYVEDFAEELIKKYNVPMPATYTVKQKV